MESKKREMSGKVKWKQVCICVCLILSDVFSICLQQSKKIEEAIEMLLSFSTKLARSTSELMDHESSGEKSMIEFFQ